MDSAKALIRSAVRAFYDTESIIIVDALLWHSALRDDDLALLIGQQTKPLRRICAKLREEGLISVHSRPEIREGYTRPINKDHYFINYHRTIDVIKYRLWKMTEHIKALGNPVKERKELFCPRCKSEWTQLESLDNINMKTGEFLCHKCDGVLQHRAEEKEGSENDMLKRFNQQLANLLSLMQKVDVSTIPENDFDSAIAVARPVNRDHTNPYVKYEPAEMPKAIPAAVKGLADTGPKEIEVDFTTSAANSEAAEKAEEQRRAKIAAQNQLPEWHTKSTVTGALTSSGTAAEAARKERENGIALKQEEEEEKKVPVEDDQAMNEYWAALKAEQERQAMQDVDSDSQAGDDEDEFEDVTMAQPAPNTNTSSPAKTNGVAANGTRRSSTTSSGSGSDEDGVDGEKAAKKAKVEPTAAQEAEDEEDDFVDAM